jgi:hypothetical protein
MAKTTFFLGRKTKSKHIYLNMYRDAQFIDLAVKIDGEGREKVEKELG